MAHEVYVFGDSHWRVFFPFLNTGSPGVRHEQDGIVTVDTIANELSGATMWGLLNDGSKNGARRRILRTLDELGGTDNVGLVFGEVDVRYHNRNYLSPDGRISMPDVMEAVLRYRRFIDEDLLLPGRVRKNVFVYYGFAYPREAILWPGWPREPATQPTANLLLEVFSGVIGAMVPLMDSRIHVILPSQQRVLGVVSDDGVHLDPAGTYSQFTLPAMRAVLDPPPMRELPL